MKLSKMPMTVANAKPENWKVPIFKTALPIPITKIVEPIIKLRFLLKSTCLSINTFNPFDAMTPNKRKKIPPITGLGMVRIKAESLPMKANKMANPAAPPMTHTE